MTEKTMNAIRRMHKQNAGVQIKIKTFGSEKLPEKISKGDWIDLRAKRGLALSR